MMQPNPTRFVFDTSGLYGTLDPHRGMSTRYIHPALLTGLSRKGRVALPREVVNEASQSDIVAARDWALEHADQTAYSVGLPIERQRQRVRSICSKLRKFMQSESDIDILSTTLALVEQARIHNTGIEYCVVLDDVSFAAACTLCGVPSIPSRVFIALIGAINLKELPVLS